MGNDQTDKLLSSMTAIKIAANYGAIRGFSCIEDVIRDMRENYEEITTLEQIAVQKLVKDFGSYL